MNLEELKAWLKAWVSEHYWKPEQVAAWVEARFYRKAVHQQTRSGTGSANLPIITDSSGYIDSTFLGSTGVLELIADTVGAMVTGNTETGITVTYQDSDNTLDFDAQTPGDARYAQLAAANTLTANNAFNSTATTGSALSVRRDLAASSTDSPVVSIVQDHASDDQDALRVQQDGSGDVVELLDGATVVLRVLDGGRLDVYNIIRALTASGLRLEDDGGNLGVFIEDGGDVGIGEASPTSRLHVSGASAKLTVNATTGNPAVQLVENGTEQWGFYYNITGNYLSFSETGVADHFAILDGTGVVLIGGLTSGGASRLGIKAGTSSNDAAVGGVLYVSTAQTGNVGTGEDDLASYSVPANTLAVNGQSLWFEAWGTMASNANSKVVRVRFGSSGTSLIATSATTTNNLLKWQVRGRITRTGAATQKGSTAGSSYQTGGVYVPWIEDVTTALNQTLSGAVSLRITGEATSNNDIAIESFIVGYDDNNT